MSFADYHDIHVDAVNTSIEPFYRPRVSRPGALNLEHIHQDMRVIVHNVDTGHAARLTIVSDPFEKEPGDWWVMAILATTTPGITVEAQEKSLTDMGVTPAFGRDGHWNQFYYTTAAD